VASTCNTSALATRLLRGLWARGRRSPAACLLQPRARAGGSRSRPTPWHRRWRRSRQVGHARVAVGRQHPMQTLRRTRSTTVCVKSRVSGMVPPARGIDPARPDERAVDDHRGHGRAPEQRLRRRRSGPSSSDTWRRRERPTSPSMDTWASCVRRAKSPPPSSRRAARRVAATRASDSCRRPSDCGGPTCDFPRSLPRHVTDGHVERHPARQIERYPSWAPRGQGWRGTDRLPVQPCQASPLQPPHRSAHSRGLSSACCSRSDGPPRRNLEPMSRPSTNCSRNS